MGIAKYSPTVSLSYMQDQKWFEKNGGHNNEGILKHSFADDQGYDSYGYSEYTGRDRAGFTENDYVENYIQNDCESPVLVNSVQAQWSRFQQLTILDMSQFIRDEIEGNPAFKAQHNRMVKLVEIAEDCKSAFYQLETTHRQLGDDATYSRLKKELSDVSKEVDNKISSAFDFLEAFYEKKLNEVIQK